MVRNGGHCSPCNGPGVRKFSPLVESHELSFRLLPLRPPYPLPHPPISCQKTLISTGIQPVGRARSAARKPGSRHGKMVKMLDVGRFPAQYRGWKRHLPVERRGNRGRRAKEPPVLSHALPPAAREEEHVMNSQLGYCHLNAHRILKLAVVSGLLAIAARPGSTVTADEPDGSTLQAQLAAGEFAPALRDAGAIANPRLRDQWLGQIAGAQARAGDTSASLNTMQDIGSDTGARRRSERHVAGRRTRRPAGQLPTADRLDHGYHRAHDLGRSGRSRRDPRIPGRRVCRCPGRVAPQAA